MLLMMMMLLRRSSIAIIIDDHDGGVVVGGADDLGMATYRAGNEGMEERAVQSTVYIRFFLPFFLSSAGIS